MSTLNFFGGSLVLLISGAVFAPVYLIAANLWGLIEDEEKQSVAALFRRFLPRRAAQPVTDANV
jgi:hypothetical protein